MAASSLDLFDDLKRSQESFHALPPAKQLEVVLEGKGKERIDLLFLSENPKELVSRLPELEIYLTLKEIGLKDGLDLISLTTAEQFQYLLDLDLWKKDQLDAEKALQWIEILLEAGEEKVREFVTASDLEWIALLLKKFIRVTTVEGEFLEMRDRIPLFTLDGYYFVDFKRSGTREIVQPLLESLASFDHDRYRRLMETQMMETETELEESNYRLRSGRMADHGFPEFEEALEIYRFVNPDALIDEKRTPLPHAETESEVPPFYLTFRKEGPFLSSVLSRVDNPSEMDRLKFEIASLCNKAMVAEAIDLFEIREMERVTRKVFHSLNLGLQSLSSNDEVRASEVLRMLSVQKIFQAGIGATLLLKKKAESILRGTWFGGDRENLLFLDPPHLERLQGILNRNPLILGNGMPEDFKDLRDLKEAETFLDMIEAVTIAFAERWKVGPETLKSLDLRESSPEAWRGITFSTILLTSLANWILEGAFLFKAVEKGRLKDLLPRIFDRDDRQKGVVRMEIRTGLREWFDSTEGDENRRLHLKAFGDFCLDLLEEEYGKISPEEEIEPRFVRGLLISHS